MKTKNTDHYFKVAKSLPLAMDIKEVRALVKLNGVSPPKNNSWFNLNNFLMMTTAALILSGLTYFMLNPKSETLANEKSIKTIENESIALETSPTFEEIKTTQKQKTEIKKVEPIEVLMNQEAILNTSFSAKLVGSELPEGPIISSNMYAEEQEEETGMAPMVTKIEGNTKTISKSINTNGIDLFFISNNRGNINIKTGDINEVRVEASISIKVDKDEFLDSALAGVDIELIKFGNTIELNNPLAKICDCNVPSRRKQRKQKTADGKKYEIEDFTISYDITMPLNLNLEVDNKYGNVSIEDLNANLDATLFKGKLNAGNIAKELKLNLKYSDGVIGNFETGKVDLFYANTKLGNAKNLEVNAKYSKVDIDGSDKLELIGFKSDFEIFETVNLVSGDIKYGTINLNSNTQEVDFVFFKSNMNCANINKLTWDGSYSNFKGNNITELEIPNAFQSNFSMNEVGEIKASGKYTDFDIEKLTKTLDITAFQGSIAINEISNGFTKVNCDTKYTNLDFNFNPQTKYCLELEAMYGSLNYPEANFEKKSESIINQTTKLKGTYNNAQVNDDALVTINTFQGRVTLK